MVTILNDDDNCSGDDDCDESWECNINYKYIAKKNDYHILIITVWRIKS